MVYIYFVYFRRYFLPTLIVTLVYLGAASCGAWLWYYYVSLLYLSRIEPLTDSCYRSRTYFVLNCSFTYILVAHKQCKSCGAGGAGCVGGSSNPAIRTHINWEITLGRHSTSNYGWKNVSLGFKHQ